MKTKSKKKNKKKKNQEKNPRILLFIFSFLFSLSLIYSLKKINILPSKYFTIAIIILSVINLFILLFTISRKKFLHIVSYILFVIMVILVFTGQYYLNRSLNFLNNSFNNNKSEITTYSVITLKNGNYDSIYKLANKEIGLFLNEDEKVSVLPDLEKYVSLKYKEYQDLFEVYKLLINKKIEAIFLQESYLDLLIDEDPDLYDKIEITLSIDKKVSLNSASDSKEVRPLNIYISGSDSRSNTIYNKSRSDVNIILTINPYTKTILQTAIPRDYYVEVSGTKGLKDKLTHAGIYGVEASKRTIENLLDIEIDYTIKVNFNAVTELVDLIGGIEIYSDTDFNSSHISGWHITKGWNKMDGAKALAYSRERYAYTSGDRHRIKNQQQVLEAIINGVINDKSLLLKYNDLLNTLSSLYRTDINKDLITNFIKDQLDTKASWNFESITIDGKGAMLPTFTAPKNKRYVMIPNEEDIISAHEKINEIYNAK